MASNETGIARRNTSEVAQRSEQSENTLWNGTLTPPQRKAVALICRRFSLDPFLGHIDVMGGKIHITLMGWLEIANRHEQFDGYEFRVLGREEKDAMLAGEDDVMFEAKVWRKDRSRPAVAFGRGNRRTVAAEHRGEKLVIEIVQARALRKALRGAFRVTEMELPDDEADAGEDGPPARDYTPFWEAVKALGVTNDQAHEILGVDSVTEVDDLRVAYRQIKASVQQQQIDQRVTPLSREEFLAAAYELGFKDKQDIGQALGLERSLTGKPPAGTTWEELLARLQEIVRARANVRVAAAAETDTSESDDFPPIAAIVPEADGDYSDFDSEPF